MAGTRNKVEAPPAAPPNLADANGPSEPPRQLGEREIAAIIFDSISEGVFTVDQDCRITSFNRAAESISGFLRDEAIGQYCFDIFRSDICQTQCALRNTLANGTALNANRVTIITRDGRKVPISISTTLLRDASGRAVGAAEFFRDLSALENLEQQLENARQFGKLISSNLKMQKVFSLLPQIAESECNVLIQGPSGSGKELIAEAIHNLSPRKHNRYIRINCAALPENLLESELFGYTKGAFTDAKRDKPGHFLLAQGGTLLLDEIAEMPVSLQSKLLRVLNNGEFQPLGSTRTLRTDARILTSTNRDLAQMIRRGEFREDLYYRINVINVQIPPLRERLEDLPLLIDHFLEHLHKRRRKTIRGVSSEVLQRLRRYDFPGNIRELENAVEHAYVLCAGNVIRVEDLPEHIREATLGEGQRLPADSEEAMLRETLRRTGGNKAKAARELGIDRSTFWRKLKRFGIQS
ncbi:MAG: sigma 54-interacting transcriptional regulator [Polyangiaceae bacterium]|nr:sigma 54-interacting transcriptional regulator [Polyangiaceae bacterium]